MSIKTPTDRKKLVWNIPNPVEQDKETSKCCICGHRNIKPEIRPVCKCKICAKTVYDQCVCANKTCMDCAHS